MMTLPMITLHLVKLLILFSDEIRTRINTPDWGHNGQLLLIKTIKSNSSEILEVLVRHLGDLLDVNVQDRQGLTPLHHSVRQTDSGLIPILLSMPGVNPDIKDNLLDQTPLHELLSNVLSVRNPVFQPSPGSDYEDLKAKIQNLQSLMRISDVNISCRTTKVKQF